VDFILISTRSINEAFNVERAKILPRVVLPNWILVRGKICSNFQRRRISLYSYTLENSIILCIKACT